MRAGFVFSLLLAILAAVFALQNPGFIDLNLGPYELRTSTALVVIVSFVAGALFGILASLPSRLKQRKQVKLLQKQLAAERPAAATPTGSTGGVYVYDEPGSGS